MKKGCEAMLNGLDSPAVRCDLHFSSRKKQVDAAPRALIGKLRVGNLGVPVSPLSRRKASPVRA